MTEDEKRKLSLGKNGADGADREGLDVSPVINNIMGYMDESDDEGGFFDKLKKAEKPDEGAFTPQETEPAGEPLIGGGKPDIGFAPQFRRTDEPAEKPAPEQYDDTFAEEDFGGAVIGGDVYDDGSQAAHEAVIEAANEAGSFDEGEMPVPHTEAAQPEEEQGTYVADENNSGAAFTMRTLDDGDRDKTPTKQPEYSEPGEEDKIAAGIAKLKSSLTVRSVVLFFAAVFSMIITSANDLELPMAIVFDREVNPSAYLFTNTILGIFSIGFAYSMVINGIKNLVKLKPDSDSLAAMNILAACIAGLVTLFDPESLKASFFHLYTSAAITGMFFNSMGKLSIVSRAEKNFRLLRNLDEVYAIRHEDEQTTAYITNNKTGGQGEIAFMKKTDFVRDFIKNSYSSDLTDLFASKTAPLILGIAIAAGVLSLIFDGNSETIQEKVFVLLAAVSGTLTLCSSFALPAIVNIPLAAAGRKVLAQKGALLGYSSVEEFADSDNVFFDAEQLFPRGSVRFADMKMLGVVPVDRSVLYAASLAAAGELFTVPAFEKMLGGRLDGLYAVRGLVDEDGEGVSGMIAGKRMLLGSRELMKRSKTEGLPPIAAEENFAGDGCVMYLSVSGRAAAMFVIRPDGDEETGKSLRALQEENVEIYVRCPDGILTRDYIAYMYGLKPEKVHMLRPRAEGDNSRMTEPAESLSASMFCSGGVSAFALLIAEARKVRYAANLGIAIQYGQMALGGLIAIVLMLSGHFSFVTPTVAIVFGLLFFGATLLVQKLKS